MFSCPRGCAHRAAGRPRPAPDDGTLMGRPAAGRAPARTTQTTRLLGNKRPPRMHEGAGIRTRAGNRSRRGNTGSHSCRARAGTATRRAVPARFAGGVAVLQYCAYRLHFYVPLRPFPVGERASARARFEAHDKGEARRNQRAWSARDVRGVRPGCAQERRAMHLLVVFQDQVWGPRFSFEFFQGLRV